MSQTSESCTKHYLKCRSLCSMYFNELGFGGPTVSDNGFTKRYVCHLQGIHICATSKRFVDINKLPNFCNNTANMFVPFQFTISHYTQIPYVINTQDRIRLCVYTYRKVCSTLFLLLIQKGIKFVLITLRISKFRQGTQLVKPINRCGRKFLEWRPRDKGKPLARWTDEIQAQPVCNNLQRLFCSRSYFCPCIAININRGIVHIGQIRFSQRQKTQVINLNLKQRWPNHASLRYLIRVQLCY